MKCNYCGEPTEQVTGQAIYPHRSDLFAKIFHRCKPCGAYAGCHPGTTRALGPLANAETRRWRQKAHAMFDPLWKNGRMNRKAAYRALAQSLGLSEDDCHIGHFEPAMCKRVIEVVPDIAYNALIEGHAHA